MKKPLYHLLTVLFLLAGFLLAGNSPAVASPQFQLTPFPTPTPGPDGRILYTVQAGDTLWRIAAVAGVTLDELRLLNNMEPDDTLFEGQILILGLGGPAEPTAEPGAAPVEEGAPSPTPTLGLEGTGTICVLLYEDLNGDALRQETETAIVGGEVSVTERGGDFSDKRGTATGELPDDPICFEELSPGSYIITMAIPDGYNETTELSTTIDLLEGSTTFLNFGGQKTLQALINEPSGGDEGGRSPLLGAVGIALLLGGLGLGIYSLRLSRRRYQN